MSRIAQYQVDHDKGWMTFNIRGLPSDPTIRNQVKSTCLRYARLELLKAATFGLMAVGSTAALVFTTYAVAKVAALLAGVGFLALASITPLYILIMATVGLGSAATFAYFVIPKVWNQTMGEAKEHFAQANHIYAQAKKI